MGNSSSSYDMSGNVEVKTSPKGSRKEGKIEVVTVQVTDPSSPKASSTDGNTQVINAQVTEQAEDGGAQGGQNGHREESNPDTSAAEHTENRPEQDQEGSSQE